MATVKITKKQMAQDEFLEGVFDLGEWLEIHWRRVAIGLGAAVAVVLAGIAWNGVRERSSDEANRLLSSGIAAYSPPAGADGKPGAPRYAEALPLFEQAEKEGGTKHVAEIARLFRARTLLALGRGSEATPILEGLMGSGHEGLAAEAKVSLAEAVETAGNPERAATLLQEVASATKGSFPPDAALLMLADLRERQGKKDQAKKAYDDLVARFPQSVFASEARQRTNQPAGAAR